MPAAAAGLTDFIGGTFFQFPAAPGISMVKCTLPEICTLAAQTSKHRLCTLAEYCTFTMYAHSQ